eukprot:GHVP01020570.1.p1 GENE.GHVP01020570.1~~GHVP01020570.1.p1  ORF type:complete len:770 (+),score=114.58 GHVP01020570.1:1073-3382(+)
MLLLLWIPKTILSATIPLGSIRIKESCVFINNLLSDESGMFLYLDEAGSSILNDSPTIFQTGISRLSPGVFFDTWTYDKNAYSQEETIRLFEEKGIYASLQRIYIIKHPHSSLPENTHHEAWETVLFSSIHPNLHRSIYSIYTGLYTLAFFGINQKKPLFLNHAETNIIISDTISALCQYNVLDKTKPTIYEKIVFGIHKDSLFPERDEIDRNTLKTIPFRNRGTILKNLREIAHRKNSIVPELSSNFRIVFIKGPNKIINQKHFMKLLRSIREDVDIKQIDLLEIGVIDQIRMVSSADMVIGYHGPSISLSIFMKPGSVLIELFPYCFKKTLYKNLSKHLRIQYFNWQNTHLENVRNCDDLKELSKCNIDWKSEKSRNFHRNQDTIIDVSELKAIFDAISDYDELKNSKYLTYAPWEQFNNQLIAFKTAVILAYYMDRILVLPQTGYRNEDEKERIQAESLKVKNNQKTTKTGSNDTLFDPLKFVWNPIEKYYTQDSLSQLPCKIIPMTVFESLNLEKDAILSISNPSPKGRYKFEQSWGYYSRVFKFRPGTIVFKKTPPEVPDMDALIGYAEFGDTKILSLGMLFNKLDFGQKKEYPLTKFYDYMEHPLYKTTTDVLQYNERIHEIAHSIKAVKDGVFDLALHIRRSDYAIKCNEYKEKGMRIYLSCYQDEIYISEIVEKLIGKKQKHIYIATESGTQEEFENMEIFKTHKISMLKDVLEDNIFDEIEEAIFEQVICINAKLFVGNYFSSYTRSIVEKREPDTTSFW